MVCYDVSIHSVSRGVCPGKKMSASEHDADRNFNCEIASVDHNDNQRVHSASRQRTDTSWRTANAT